MDKQVFIQQRATAYNEMKSLMSRNNGALTADEQTQYQKAEGDYQNAQRSLQRMEKFQVEQGQMEEQRQQREERQKPKAKKSKEERLALEKSGLVKYLSQRSHLITKDEREMMVQAGRNQSPRELRGTDAQKTTPGSAGGFLISEELFSSINLGREFVSDMEMACTVINTQTGRPINHPKIDDTGTDGAQYTEASRDSTAIPVADITVGNTQLNSYFYSSQWAKLTLEAVQDIEFSLSTWLIPLLMERINRGKNPDLTTGNGSGKPTGIITSSSLGKTAASATAITHEELMDLFRSVNKSYRTGSKVAWMCNDAIEGAILKLGLTAAQDFNPVRIDPNGAVFIMGRPVHSNADMASTLAADNKVLLFGDFSQYVIRKVQGTGIVFTDQQFIQNGHYGYMAYDRIDGDYVGAVAALKYLKMAAS